MSKESTRIKKVREIRKNRENMLRLFKRCTYIFSVQWTQYFFAVEIIVAALSFILSFLSLSPSSI